MSGVEWLKVTMTRCNNNTKQRIPKSALLQSDILGNHENNLVGLSVFHPKLNCEISGRVVMSNKGWRNLDGYFCFLDDRGEIVHEMF